MYSRNLSEGKISIPENYDGNAFRDIGKESPPEPTERNIKVIGSPSADVKMSPVGEMASIESTEGADEPCEKENSDVSAGIFKFFDKSSLGGLFGKGVRLGDSMSLRLPKIGTEEILLIAIALFLFFSKDGDKECAIMLLLLLLVGD